ncbi:MAG TPA: HAD family phosphatase [Novosphingobium sp.]|nr:HAD family phosphatase [Novosphingobium sp.]
MDRDSRPGVVVFDVGRVLVEWDLRCLFAKMIADPAELEWFVTHVVTEEWHFQHDAGRPLADMVPERQAQFPAYAPHIEAYATRFNETIPGPVPGTHALVDRLAQRGVPLFAITNFGAEFWPAFVPTQPVMRHFADVVVSGVEKMVKPDPAIFELAARRFGHAPAQMLFVDDNTANVAAAAKLGWHTHHFVNGAAALEADLARYGLLG